jgi:hypothetical protein
MKGRFSSPVKILGASSSVPDLFPLFGPTTKASLSAPDGAGFSLGSDDSTMVGVLGALVNAAISGSGSGDGLAKA